HKGDDWTSIAALSGAGLAWVDIGQYSSTAGNDASIVWNHASYSGAPPAITAKTFTVTGGTSTTGAGKMIPIKTAGATIADGTHPGNTTIAQARRPPMWMPSRSRLPPAGPVRRRPSR